MNEVVPGIRHFTARHDHIGLDVSSYWLPEERVIIDPMVPAEGLDAFAASPPEHLLLSNRHHDRHAWDYVDALRRDGPLHPRGPVRARGPGRGRAVRLGDELPGGIVAHEVGAICPDETALHIPAHGALACADGVVRWQGVDGLGFVPDKLMDEPHGTKAALRTAFARLADELEFDALLLAHGGPVASGRARRAARRSPSARPYLIVGFLMSLRRLTSRVHCLGLSIWLPGASPGPMPWPG